MDQQPDNTLAMSLDSQEHLKKASREATAIEVPGYRLTKELGQGSFGTVWEAERHQTGQRVAIKLVIHEQSLNWEYFSRELAFLRELEDHPYTLTVLDADLTHKPPYIVTPLVEGGSLAKADRSDIQRTTVWLCQVAEALHYIHSRGVIHCDLKPSNILLSGTESIRVGDFGQSRNSLAGEATWGTIGFMAPEQCVRDSEKKITPAVRWDVYGFGATAYWLLTGQRARMKDADDERLSNTADVGERLDLYRACLEGNPLRPIRELNPRVDRPLAAIVEACLHCDPERRTESMSDVIEDLKRRERGEPLRCRRPWSPAYLAGVALRRREVQLLLFVILLACIGGYYGWMVSRQRQADFHVERGIRAQEVGNTEEAYLHWLAGLDYDPGDRSTLARLSFLPVLMTFPHDDTVHAVAFSPDGKLLATASEDKTATVWETDSGRRVATIKHGARVADLALGPAGTVATASWDGTAVLYDLDQKRRLFEFDHRNEESDLLGMPIGIDKVLFSSDGKLLATSAQDGTVRLWDTSTGQRLKLEIEPNLNLAQRVALSPDGRLLAALSGDTGLQLWDTATGEPVFAEPLSHDGIINDLRFSPDGKSLASASDDRTVRLWNVASGQEVLRLDHSGPVRAVRFSPSGVLAAAVDDGTVQVWKDLEHPETEPLKLLHRQPAESLDFSPDGRLLVVGTGEKSNLRSTAGSNGAARVWDADTGNPVTGVFDHEGAVTQVAFNPDGRSVATVSGAGGSFSSLYKGMARTWAVRVPVEGAGSVDVTPGLEITDNQTRVKLPAGGFVTHGPGVDINQAVVSPDGTLLATGSTDRTARVWTMAGGTAVGRPIPHEGSVEALAFDASGEWLATAATKYDETAVRIWEAGRGLPISPPLYCPDGLVLLRFAPEGLVGQTKDGKTWTWSLEMVHDGKLKGAVEGSLRARLDPSGGVGPAP